jgi:hypothetical protein
MVYTVDIDDSEVDDPDVVIMLIKNGCNSCFHIAVPWNNSDIENAKAVCSQAILYRTKEDDPDLYFAIYDIRAQMVSFCLCSPSQEAFEDVSQYFIQREGERVAERLKVYIVSNAEVLS